ncbi:MAG: hypothetical protein DCE90_14260 [Pseudanabaena sp.]|nr:MAG: hypothetical protein DCE90_14260 [Pseudanabaena sp.]
MNPKLLMSLFLGVKASLFLPIASFAAVTEPSSYQSNRQSPIKVEVVELNQNAQPLLIADRNNDNKRNRDNKRNSDKGKKDYDNQRNSGNRQPVRVVHPVRPVVIVRPTPLPTPIRTNTQTQIRIIRVVR